MSWIESNFNWEFFCEKRWLECPSPQFMSVLIYAKQTKMHIIELVLLWSHRSNKLRSSSRWCSTYRIPEQAVQQNEPVVTLTYVTPLAPHSKQFRLTPDATISRKLLSILSLLLSTFGFIILSNFFFCCLWITEKSWNSRNKNNFFPLCSSADFLSLQASHSFLRD